MTIVHSCFNRTMPRKVQSCGSYGDARVESRMKDGVQPLTIEVRLQDESARLVIFSNESKLSVGFDRRGPKSIITGLSEWAVAGLNGPGGCLCG